MLIALSLTHIRSNIMKNKFDVLKGLVMSLEDDFAKFYEKGNKAAGTRVRKGMQDLKEMAQSIRQEVQNAKNQGWSAEDLDQRDRKSVV